VGANTERRETSEYREYKKKLLALGEEYLPAAIAEAVNQVAGFAHVQQQRNVKATFIVRSPFTLGSFKFWKASPKKNIAKINAVTGSVSPYLPVHEAGGKIAAKRTYVPIPTLAARGGNIQSKIKPRYYAGKLGPNQFVGAPRGLVKGKARPFGVYARTARNKHLTMIRNITSTSIDIKRTNWHTEAVGRYAKREVLTDAFIRQAQQALAAAVAGKK